MNDLLELDSVTLKFGGLTALSQVSLKIRTHSPGEGVQGIIGPNGAGKSTLFNLVTGIYKPSEGRILFEGREIQNLNTVQIVRFGIARTFQNIRLLTHLSVLDNLRMVTAFEREGSFWQSLLGFSAARRRVAEITERAHSVLALVGLSQTQDRLATSLPYGDQRKLEIARALMSKPKLLLLDEPAAGMNAVEKEGLGQILRKILAEKVTVLVIEHDMKFIMGLCEHITVLNQGKVCAQGTPHHVQNDPQVIETYLGKRATPK